MNSAGNTYGASKLLRKNVSKVIPNDLILVRVAKQCLQCDGTIVILSKAYTAYMRCAAAQNDHVPIRSGWDCGNHDGVTKYFLGNFNHRFHPNAEMRHNQHRTDREFFLLDDSRHPEVFWADYNSSEQGGGSMRPSWKVRIDCVGEWSS